MSTRPVSGIVSNVSHRDFPDRNGGQPVRLFSFQLEGSNQWFRTGNTPLPAGVGQTINFVANDQKVDVHTVTVIGTASQTTVAPPPSVQNVAQGVTGKTVTVPPHTPAMGSAQAGYLQTVKNVQAGLSKDQYWANKENRDLEKEARFKEVNEPRMALSVGVEAASKVVAAALQHDALGFGTTAKSKRVEMLGDFVEEMALRFGTFITNAPENLKNYKDSIPVEVTESASRGRQQESSSSVDSQE